MSRPKAWDGTGSPAHSGLWRLIARAIAPCDAALPRVTDKFLDLLRGWSRERGHVRGRTLSDGQERDCEWR